MEHVNFNGNSDRLLVSTLFSASLLDLKKGSVTRRFLHSCFFHPPCPVFTDEAVVYEHRREETISAMKVWSVRSGLRDVVIPNSIIRQSEWPQGIHVDESRVVVGVGTDDHDVVFPADPTYPCSYTSSFGTPITGVNALLSFSLDEMGKQMQRVDRVNLSSFYVDASSNRVLLNFYSGVEMLNLSRADSLWLRDNLACPVVLGFTADRTGVVVTSEKGLLVLDSDSGETRFTFSKETTVPVFSDSGVQGLLRLTDDFRVDRLSLRNGSVIDTANLDILSLRVAKSDPKGNLHLVVDEAGQVLLWDMASGDRRVFEANSGLSKTLSDTKLDNVAFSPDGRILAIVETDGMVGLWDVSRGPAGLRRLARLVLFDNGGWAVVGEDGRYDASDPADLEGLAWVMPDAPTEPVPLSIFYSEYYEPRLLPRLLAGEEFPPITSLSALDRTQPQAEIANVEAAGPNSVTVTVEVRKAGANGVYNLKLFRDGRLVGLDEHAGQPGLETRDHWRITFPNIALPTSGGDAVEFSTYAFNGDGVKSATHQLSYTLPRVEPIPRRAFVIVVGVNAYQNPSWDLHYAAEDAKAMGSIVARHLEASGTFKKVHTVSLITERDQSGAITGIATRAALLAILDVLAGKSSDRKQLNTIPGAASLSKARPDDLVYLAFSGHGLSGNNGLFHLFLSDIGSGKRRAVNSALIERTLNSDLLTRHLRRVDAGDFVMVIDACNSAASVEGRGFKPGPMGSRGLGQLAYDKAMRVLAASEAETLALESDQIRHGLLTFALLHEGLAGGSADRAPMDSAISFSEMLSYGVERVPLLHEDIRNGSFTSQGRGFTAAFRPNAVLVTPPGQQPKLFDFSRGEQEVYMPVMHQIN